MNYEPGKKWLEKIVRRLQSSVVRAPGPDGSKCACPCCGFLTLRERGRFEICPVCSWEDDGQDDADASVVRGGPNGSLSLEDARKNFRQFGACDERSTGSVRTPSDDEIPPR